MKLIEFSKIDVMLAVKNTLNDKKRIKVHKGKSGKSRQMKTEFTESTDSTKRGWKGKSW